MVSGIATPIWFAPLALSVMYAAAATPPCIPYAYGVSYASPIWSITFLSSDGDPGHLWYQDPWNGSFQLLGSHVGRSATAQEPVTLQDTDENPNLTANDEVQVWDPDRGLTYLRLAWGETPWNPTGGQGFWLTDGYRSDCAGGPPQATSPTPPSSLLIVAAFVGVGAGLAVVARRYH